MTRIAHLLFVGSFVLLSLAVPCTCVFSAQKPGPTPCCHSSLEVTTREAPPHDGSLVRAHRPEKQRPARRSDTAPRYRPYYREDCISEHAIRPSHPRDRPACPRVSKAKFQMNQVVAIREQYGFIQIAEVSPFYFRPRVSSDSRLALPAPEGVHGDLSSQLRDITQDTR